jgi:hypothetical protein
MGRTKYKYIYYKYYSSFVKNMYLYKLFIHIEVLVFISCLLLFQVTALKVLEMFDCRWIECSRCKYLAAQDNKIAKRRKEKQPSVEN